MTITNITAVWRLDNTVLGLLWEGEVEPGGDLDERLGESGFPLWRLAPSPPGDPRVARLRQVPLNGTAERPGRQEADTALIAPLGTLSDPGVTNRLPERPTGTPFWISGVNTPDELLGAKAYGADAVQGLFWRVGQDKARSSTDQMNLMQLLDRVNSDADSHELETFIGRSPTLLFNLLRLVNSVAIRGNRQRIHSISFAIELLGRRQLQRWVTLLLYAERFDEQNLFSPLLVMTSLRARMMESLCRHLGGHYRSMADLAFMTGMLSLIDLAMGDSMAHLLRLAALAEPGEAALLRQEGPLAPLLRLVEASETGDANGIKQALDALGIAESDWAGILLSSWSWVDGLVRGSGA